MLMVVTMYGLCTKHCTWGLFLHVVTNRLHLTGCICSLLTQGPNKWLVCPQSVVSMMVLVLQGLSANGAGLMRIISCCSQLGQWDQAYASWTVLQAAGMQPDGACLNALLAALQAAKQWQHVVQVFQAARQTQVANVGGCCIQPRGLLLTLCCTMACCVSCLVQLT